MNDRQTKFNELLSDVSGYLTFQQYIYGEEIYREKQAGPTEMDFSISSVNDLHDLEQDANMCHKCALWRARKHVVFGTGNKQAEIMLIGEAPGSDEDRQGLPFIGAAGQLLTKILQAINLTREEVYITNVLKCRPPDNRDPLPEEQKSCQPYLFQQIGFIQPKFILALGRIAGQCLLNTTKTIKELRGHVYEINDVKVIVTYHPAALLRNPQWKRDTWGDVQKLQQLYQQSKEV